MVQPVVTFHPSTSLGSYRRMKSEVVREEMGFWNKRPLAGRLWKFHSKRIHHLADPRIVFKFREIWPIGSQWNRALLTWQKNWQALPLSLLRGSRPKSVRASSRQYTQSAPNFIRIRTLLAELQPDAWTLLKRPQSVSNTRRNFFAE